MGPFGLMEITFILGVLGILIGIAALVVLLRRPAQQGGHAIQSELDRHFAAQREWLDERLRAIEDRSAITASAPTPVATPPPPKISEDKLMILGAVLACHFGKRVKIRTARVISIGSGANVWSQQGRAAVQASHTVVR